MSSPASCELAKSWKALLAALSSKALTKGHKRAGEIKVFVGLLVEDAAAPLFAKGQRVKFYAAAWCAEPLSENAWRSPA